MPRLIGSTSDGVLSNARASATFSADPPQSTTRVNSQLRPSETANVERSWPIDTATSAEPPRSAGAPSARRSANASRSMPASVRPAFWQALMYRSTFAVSDGRNCEFTRVVDWGGAALNVALARAFDSTPSEVEQIKRGISLDGSTTPEGLNEEQAAIALDAVRRQVQSFARELVSSLQFYQNQPGSLGIGEIVVTGGTAQLPGLAEELERLIGVHVRVGDPLARLKVAKKVSVDQVGSLAVAIGLGIED